MTADEAMSRHANGDLNAFTTVYDVVAPRLERFLQRRIREGELVQDIIQQTLFQMHAGRGTFIPGSPVLPWAYGIARRLMIDWLRKRIRQQHLEREGQASTDGDRIASPTPTGEEAMVAREMEARLLAAYRLLTEDQRAAFDLVADEGLSHAQAACVLGTTVMGIKLRMHRAYLTLRAAVNDGGLSPERGRR